MGWFSKKSKKPEDNDVYSLVQVGLQTRIFKKYPIGEEGNYLGVVIRITHHIHYRKGMSTHHISMPVTFPAIRCDYVNKNGEIKCVEFSCSEVDTWEVKS